MEPQIITKSVYTWGTPCCDKFRDMIRCNMLRLSERADGTPMIQIVSTNAEVSYPLNYCPFCKADLNYENASN